MSETLKKFQADSEKIAFNRDHRSKIKFNMSRYDTAVVKGKGLYSDQESARKRAAQLKEKVIYDLEKYIIQFQRSFESRGGKVIFAENSKDAIVSILNILNKYEARSVVKSKSMITEEIEFNANVEKAGIETVETDLGEYIVQVAGEKPYHIVTPAMHKSKEDVAELFHKVFDTPPESTPKELTNFVRHHLRDKFFNADIGVTGANFLIAETGSVALTENEGNGMMSFSFPKIHIAISGIEKLIPSLSDVDLYWPLLATNGTGQHLTVYNSIISGPKQSEEEDGPEEMYVILLDNGRTNLLAQEKQSIALSCIKCGACLNACPVYRNIGGYTYNTTYSGPIGSVITPFLKDMENYKHLSYASSLCGKCTEVCPVKIPLHDLLLENRHESVKKGFTKRSERFAMKIFGVVLKDRNYMDKGSSAIKNFFLKKFFRKTWGNKRELPALAEKSFHKMWKEHHRQ